LSPASSEIQGAAASRKRRLDLGLLQREVAERLGADEASVVNWECNATLPALHWRPWIIEFLGYAPFDSSWGPGERLRAAREALGLSRWRLARKHWEWMRGR
jgi:transcriptional regulator with XRE-family HTH domain